MGAFSQWAEMTRIDSGRGRALAQADSSPGQIGSSASGGAPWLRYTAGIRLLLMASC
jgi:hypothetical protein